MSDKIQYDDEGFPGEWIYSHKSNSKIFIREGESPAEAFSRRLAKKEEQGKLYQIRKNEEQAEEKTHNYTAIEKNYKEKAQNLYKEAYEQGFRLPPDLDYDNPESLVKAAASLVKACPKYGNSVGEIACYRTAGAVAAILDKRGLNSYRCYIGACSPASKSFTVETTSNHVWIEYNGKIYETFPGHNSKDLTYHKPNTEVFFYL